MEKKGQKRKNSGGPSSSASPSDLSSPSLAHKKSKSVHPASPPSNGMEEKTEKHVQKEKGQKSKDPAGAFLSSTPSNPSTQSPTHKNSRSDPQPPPPTLAPTTPQTTHVKKKLTLGEKLKEIGLMVFCAKREELNHMTKQLRSEEKHCIISTEPEYDDEVDPNHAFAIHIGTNKLGKKQKFYAVCGVRQGPIHAAVALSWFIAKYTPRSVISVGICAGIDGKSQVKDVVFGSSAVSYEEGSVDEEGKLHLDHILHPAGQGLTNIAVKVISETGDPSYKDGAFLTGSAVRRDLARLMAELEDKVSRQARAIDMEAAAILHACSSFSVDGYVVKCVADMADISKSNDYHADCMRRAGLAALRMLASLK